MDNNFSMSLEEMNKVLELYFENEISKEVLASWAIEEYQSLIHDGSIVFLEKLPYYNFLNTIMQIDEDEKWRNVGEDDIKQIRNVLLGRENMSYTFKMKMPLENEPLYNILKKLNAMKTYESEIIKIKSIIENYSLSKEINKEDIKCIYDFVVMKPKEVKTILDMLVVTIIEEFLSSYYIDIDEGRFKYSGGHHKLFFTDTNEIDDINKLLKLINCYIGVDYFNVLILYQRGKASVSLVV